MGRLLICTIALLCAGCTTINGIKNSQGHGVQRIYSQPYDKVYRASLNAIQHLDGFSLLEDNKEKGMIIATHSSCDSASSGERVAIFINRVDEQQTKMEVVSKAIVKTHLFAPHWESQIFQLIDMQLEEKSR